MKRSAQVAIPTGTLLIAAIVIYFLLSNSPKASQQPVINRLPVIQTLTARQETVRVPVYTRGVVAPRTRVTLISEVNGSVVEVAPQFNNGGFFKSGEVLVRIDPAYYLLEITKKQRAVDAAIMHLEEVSARAHVARKGAKKNATDFALHIPQIKDAKSQLAAANADLKLARLKLSHTEIKAPFDGRIKTANVDKNQYVSNGQLLADIYSLNVAEVRLPISDHHFSLIHVPVQYQDEAIYLKAMPMVTLTSVIGGKEYRWRGNIVRSEGGLDENRLLYVVAEVKDPYKRDATYYKRPPLEIGRFVEAEIEGREQRKVVVIPRQALRGQQTVWVMKSDDRLTVREVDVLYRGRDQVYISNGISTGEKVIVTPLDFVVDGMKVRHADVEAVSSIL